MSKPPDIWMLFQTVVSKFLRLITKKIIKNRAIFDILLIHNLGIDMVCESDIMGLIHHEKDPYGVLSPSGAFSFWDSSKLER